MSLRNWLRRSRQDRERAEEMQAHLEHAIQHYIDRGLSPDEARRKARLRFGNPRAHRERVDDLNRLPLADALARDLNYAVRMLRRTPAFSATVIVTLALVIGATSAVLGLADAILLRALPYPEPDRLAVIGPRTTSPRGDYTGDAVDGAMWEAVRDRARLIDAAVCIDGANGVNFVSGTTASFVQQQRVGSGYFRVLGISPRLGHEFTPDEDRPGGPAVAVLAYEFWQRVLQGQADVLGQSILLRGQPYEVIGVMPKGFIGIGDADVWTPLRPGTKGEGGGSNYLMIARLRPGVSWEQATAELATLGPDPFRLLRPVPEDAFRRLVTRQMQAVLVESAREPIVILAFSVGVVLLIACVNIAALLLSRGGSRSKEIATRMALGSGRGAVVRQLMVESVLLAAIGGGLGVLVSVGALEGLKAIGGTTFGDWQSVGLDGRTVAITIGLSALTSLVFGLVPAVQASRIDLQAALVEGGTRNIAGGSRHLLRRFLVIAEVALGVVLLVAAGLLTRQFSLLRGADPGFNPANLFTASVSIQDARYPTAVEVNRLFDGALERLQRTPGIRAAAVSLGLPYTRLLNMGFRIEGDIYDPDRPPIANVGYVTPGFFDTFGMTITAGRPMSSADTTGAPAVVVVNKMFARIYFKDRDPIRRRLLLSGGPREIVGIAGDVQQSGSGFMLEGMKRGPILTSPTIYVPAAQTTMGMFSWFAPVWTVRADSAGAATAAIQHAIAEVDPLMPVGAVRSMAEVAARATARPRLMMTLVGVLALAAVLLAAIGLHGLIAHSVAERRREFGIRLALGATPGATLRAVVMSGIALAVVGAIIGGALSAPATSLIAAFLVDVPRSDVPTYLGVALLLFIVAAISSVMPAVRILRLDPAKTLRE
jgi:predicted permease